MDGKIMVCCSRAIHVHKSKPIKQQASRASSQAVEEKQRGKIRKRLLLDELKVCSSTRNLKRGREIHVLAVETGSNSCIHVATALVSMYTKCGSIVEAREVFDAIEQPDVVSWTAIILGYVDRGESVTALELFETMKCQGCAPDSFTLVAALKACASLASKRDGKARAHGLERGKQIHLEIGLQSDIYVQNTLIDMYAKCGSMLEARLVFDSIKHPTVVSWTALILGYAENGKGNTALELFSRMTCAPNSFTHVAALKACTSLASQQTGSGRVECLERGKQIHSRIRCPLNIYLRNTLIDMYTKCGSMCDAQKVFDGCKHPTVVSWTSLILGYAEQGDGVRALDLFATMRSQGFVPDSFTFVAALKACSSIATRHDGTEALEWGRRIHSEIGCRSDIYLQSILIDMYSKCGSMSEARSVFDGIRFPDQASWNALISGYAENGDGMAALGVWERMKFQGVVPDSFTFAVALKACSLLGALESGMKIHGEIVEVDLVLVNCLVDFYSKCGCLVEAQKVFDLHPTTRDVRTWTALLAGYSRLGDSEAVFRLFRGMQDAGFQPDAVTFLCILTCCNHAGLVDKASQTFEAMSAKYGITPTIEHYTCMVDLLGRSNKLDDAVALLRSMPCGCDKVTWMAILDACRKR